jgi:TnpA family transposase
MKKHEILSPQSRTALFDPPTDAGAIVRHYTFSLDDMALIRQRRRAANRLGFAVNLAYLRLPGRVLGIEEIPPADMLAYIAKQITCEPASFDVYAQRGETRCRARPRPFVAGFVFLGLRSPFRIRRMMPGFGFCR